LAIAQVSSKLVNLRGYPEKSDKIGPWYHMFGVMMVGALTSERQASIMADLEVASRYLIHPYVKSYSAPDTEKSSWDEVAKDVMKTIHPTIFHSEVPDKRSIQVLSAGAEPLDGNTNAKVNLPIDLSVKYLLSGMSKDSSATVKETAFVDGPAKLNLPSTEYSVKAGINNEKTKSWTFVPSKPGKYTFHYKLGEKCGSRDGSISFVVEPAPPKTSNKEEQSGNGNIIGTSVVIGTNTKGIADIKLGPIGRTYTPNPGVEIGPNFCKCGTSTLTWSNIPTSLTAGQTYSPIMQVAKQDIPLLIATWVNSREDTLLPSEKRSAKPTDVKSSDPKRLVADGSFIAGESSSPRELFIRGSCIASGPKGDQTTNFLIKWEFGPNKKAKKPVETPKSSTTPQIDSSKNAASTPTLPPLPQPGERIDGANKIPEAIAPNSSTGSSKTVDLNGIWNCALTSLGGRMTGQYGNQAIPGGVTSNDPVRISIQGNEMTMQAVNNDKPEQILRGTFDGTTARLHAQWSIGSESGESTVTLRYNSASNTFEGEGDVHATPA
ncbi:MAG: hypothetical protein K2X29_09750, partial [Candidatus Obscuribacterales bacterium]|nr:hypothetical protein [Candidatus Obscuribacterales bacterium]